MAQESKGEHPRVLVVFLRRKGKAWKFIEILKLGIRWIFHYGIRGRA